MKFETISSQVVLTTLKTNPEVAVCCLANTSKQLYTLSIHDIEPDENMVELDLPKGRQVPIDAKQDWHLSFRDTRGAFQLAVKSMVSKQKTITFLLENYGIFFARRENIRLATDSRNPTQVSFTYKDHQLRAALVDFSLNGIGLLLEAEHEMGVDTEIGDCSFALRSQPVSFRCGKVVHMTYVEKGVRLGCCFKNLKVGEQETIRKAFDAWYLSQSPSFTLREDR